MEARRIPSLWPHTQASGSGRFGRQQQLHFLGLEDGNPGTLMQCVRHRRHCRSLPYRRLQMESHRAPPVFRDLQKLGRRGPRQLRKDAQIHSHHQYPNRLGGDRVFGSSRVSNTSQTRPAADLVTPPQTQQATAALELHHCTQSVKLILRRPLANRSIRERIAFTKQTLSDGSAPLASRPARS